MKHRRHRRRIAFWLAFGAAAGLAGTATAQDSAEYEIKAAMVYNIARFVSWPPAESAAAIFRIGIAGDDDFLAAMTGLTGKTIGGAEIEVVAVDIRNDLSACHAVVFGGEASRELGEALASLKDAPVLTIGDVEGFTAQGGMVELRRVRNKLRFAASPDAARQSRLQLSSQLLKLAVSAPGE